MGPVLEDAFVDIDSRYSPNVANDVEGSAWLDLEVIRRRVFRGLRKYSAFTPERS